MKSIMIAAGMTAASITIGLCLGQARAHDGYEQLRNPVTGQLCCNSSDCRPVDASEIGEDGEFYTWGTARFPKRQSQPSPDEKYHVCAWREWMLNGTGEWKIRCLLRPSPGA